MLLNGYFFFESVALVTVIFQFKKLKNSIYKYFLPFLLFIVFYEYGNIRDWFYINNSNLYITNISEITCFLFYGIVLQTLINNKTYKKIIRVLIPLTLLCSLLNMAFLQGFWKLDSITILLQFAVIIFIV